MKITICASIAFYNEMLEAKSKLETFGHEVYLPPSEVKNEKGDMISVSEYYVERKLKENTADWISDRKGEVIRLHFEKIESSDAILVLNYSKNNIDNYIGGNTFLEMGIAVYLKKKIFLLNDIPELSYREEILGMKPIILFGDLEKIMFSG
jgi:hypothetical protein